MFENETYEVILERMLNRLPSDIDKREGSVAFDMLSVAAIELAMDKVDKDNLLSWCFTGEDMPSNFLDLRVAEFGLTRYPGVSAQGTVKFTSTLPLTIPIDTEIKTETEKLYLTAQDLTLTLNATTGFYEGSCTVEALEEGVDYNIGVNQAMDTVLFFEGLESVSNTTAISGGIDAETDSELLARFFAYAQNPAASGNAADYEKWALEHQSISKAACTPVWNGAGTVKVAIVGLNNQIPDATLIAAVKSYIETKRPIGANVTVVAATKQTFTLSATLTLNTGYTTTDAQNQIRSKVNEHLSTLSIGNCSVLYSKISSLLSECEAILDFNTLKINGGTTNITINADSFAELGTITV